MEAALIDIVTSQKGGLEGLRIINDIFMTKQLFGRVFVWFRRITGTG